MIANANEYNLDLSKFERIDTRDGNCKPSGTQGSGRESYDDINWVNNAISSGVDNVTSQTDNQYVKLGGNVLQMVLSYLGKAREAAANKKADEVNTNVSNLQASQDTIKQDVDSQIEAINSLIQANQETINNLIQSLEETQAEIQEENARKEELAGNIADAQQRYADAQTDEEKEDILEELTGYNEELLGIVSSLQTKVEASQTTSEEITNVKSDNAPLQGQIEKVQTTGQKRIEDLGRQIVAQKTDDTVTNTLAKVEEGVSKTAGMLALEFEATASGSSAIPIVGSAASAAAHEMAGICRDVERDTYSSSQVYSRLIQQTGPMLANLDDRNRTFSSSISSFAPTALGGFNNINSNIDLAYGLVNPIIEATGSIQTLGETVEGLSAAIEEERSKLPSGDAPENEGDGNGEDKGEGSDSMLINFDLKPLTERLFA